MSKSPSEPFHEPARQRQYTSDRLVNNPGYDPANFHFTRRTAFFSKEEYMTITAIHVNSEKAANAKALEDFGREHRIVFQKLPENKDSVFYGYLKLPTDKAYRLKNGTKLRLNFDEWVEDQGDEKDTLIEWSAKVISEDIGPNEHATLIINRPWSRMNQKYLGRLPETIEFKGGSVREMQTRIHDNPGVVANIEIIHSDQVQCNILDAIENMNRVPNDQERTEWNDNVDTLLLGSRFDQLSRKNVFTAVLAEFPEPLKLMTLNPGQTAAVTATFDAPGGMTLINGPPGTGKSAIGIEILKPFFRSKDVHSVLVVSSTNTAVNAIAAKIDKLMTQLKADKVIPETRYGLRVHSKRTETALRNSDIAKRFPLDTNARPAVWETELILENLDEVNRFLVANYKISTKETYANIQDTRLAHPHLSVGLTMLEIAGVVSGPCTHPDPTKFADFRNGNEKLANGSTFTKERIDDYKQHVEDLWTYTVQNASYIVGTTANMGSNRLLKTLASVTRLIFVDNAAYEREDNLVPFFAASFEKLDGFIQVGDTMQLLPIIDTTKEEDLFVDQFRISHMGRMMNCGFPVHWLVEQHRMVDEIANLANDLSYDGRLITATDARLENRPAAQQFRSWASKFVKIATNVFIVNVPECDANLTQTGMGSSRYNDLFVIIAGATVQSLLTINKYATIAILTAYNAQKFRLLDMVRGLQKIGIAGTDRITVDTFDGSQGQEYDYVLIDILVNHDDKKLGFLADGRRLNVATTRCHDGLIIISDIGAIRDSLPRQLTYIARFLNKLHEVSYTIKKYDVLPSVTFYK